jgi:hypothetical protein
VSEKKNVVLKSGWSASSTHTSPRCLFPEKEEKNEEKYASTKERYPRGCVYVRKEIALFINHIREMYPIPNSIGPTGQP